MNGHLGCFQFLAFINNAAVNTGVRISLRIHIFVFFVGKELLDCVVVLFFTFWETSILLYIVATLIYIQWAHVLNQLRHKGRLTSKGCLKQKWPRILKARVSWFPVSQQVRKDMCALLTSTISASILGYRPDMVQILGSAWFSCPGLTGRNSSTVFPANPPVECRHLLEYNNSELSNKYVDAQTLFHTLAFDSFTEKFTNLKEHPSGWIVFLV